MFLVFYFFVVIALPMALGIYVVVNGLQRSRRCPACADETLALRSPLRRAASRLFRNDELQLRWCIGCGWQGTVRLRAAATAAAAGGVVTAFGDGTAAFERIDVRSLQLDGHSWRVMVQCWAHSGQWVGRLLFIDADGRECGEPDVSIEGSSAAEVLSRAFAIPDRSLEGRLRRATH